MAKTESRLLSGRIKTKTGNNLDSRRSAFLSLDNAEPNFGNPDSDRYILASLADGTRLFLKLNKGFLVSADSVSADESTFEIDPSGLTNAAGTTLAEVLDDLDSAISDALLSGAFHDDNFNGSGTVSDPLTLDSDLRIFGITGDSATFTNITRTGTTVTAATYGSVTEIPVFTVDASGFIDSIGEVSISTTLNTSGETGTGSVSLLDSSLNIAAGEGINTEASGNTITVSGEDASTTNKGVANFDSGDFTVSSGYVSVKTSGIDNDQLAGSITNDKLVNTTIKLGSTTVALGDSSDNLTIDSADITKLDVSGTATLASASVTDLTNDRIVVAGTSGELEDDANLTYDGSTLTVANNTASTSSANGALVVTGGVGIGGALNVNGNTEIAGDLTVTGTTTTIDVQTLAIQDPLIHLADSNESADEVDIGFIGHYYDAALGGRQHTGLFRDATDDKYYLFAQYQDSALDSSPRSNVIDRSDPSFVLADLNAATIVADTFSGTVSADSITTTNFTATSVDINGGTIDGTTIATSDITVGSGKTLNVSDGTLTLAENQISGDNINGGTIDSVTVTNFISGNVNIDGGFIDGTAIGHTTPDSGTFTNLARTSPSGVTAGVYGSQIAVPIITVDASGFIDSIGVTGFSSVLTTEAENGTGTVNLLDSSLNIVAGEGINTEASGNTVTIAGENASTSNKGVASFDAGDFSVSSGAVSIKTAGVGNDQLEFDSVTVTAGSGLTGGGSIALGGSTELKLDSAAVKGLFSGGANIDYDNSTGEIAVALSGVTAGIYGTSTRIPIITVDSYGQVDSIGIVPALASLGDTIDSIFHNPLTGELRVVTDVASFFTDIVLDPYTTDSLSEGTTNLYYTKTRVDSDIDQAFNENPSFGGSGAPFSVTSDSLVTNLNADKLDGISSESFLRSDAADIKTSGDLRFNDNIKLTFGASDDLRIYHDQTNSYIEEIGTGDFKLLTNGQSIILEDSTNEKVSGKFTPSTSVELYYAGNKKFETSATGVNVTGTVTADGLNLGDNEKAQFGTDNDLQIYHDGSNSFITDGGTGDLIVRASNTLYLQSQAGAENYLTAVTNGAVSLYYDNSAKIATTSTGVDVTGEVTADSATFTNITRTGATVVAGTYGSQTAIPVVTIDASGFVDSIGTEALSTVLSTSAETGTGSVNLLDSSLEIAAGVGIDTTASSNTVTVEIDSADLAAYFSKVIVHDNTDGFASDEHVPHSSISINANNGLTGGGTINANVDLAVGAGTGIRVNANDIDIDSADLAAYYSKVINHDSTSGFVADEHVAHSDIEINAGKGLTGGGNIASDVTLDIDSANVREMFSGGNGLTYNSGTGTFAVGAGTGIRVNADDVEIDSSELGTYYSKVINHDSTSGFIANEHINHANVNINAGKGLTGGGDITSSLVIDIDSANVRAMFSGGDGLTYNNGTGEFTVVGGDGITANADEIKVTVDDDTIELDATDGSGAVRVKDGGITNAKLENSSVTVGSTEIALGATSATLVGLTQVDAGQVNVDNIRIDGNTISTIGGSYMYIDPHPTDSAGTLVILGNLQVDGETTTIQSSTVTISDKNIVLADSATTPAQANGAGITVNGGNATITYDGGTERWDFNKAIEADSVYADLSGNVTSSSVDIDGGNIDGVNIGSATPDSATFTGITVNNNIIVSGTVDGRDIATDGTKLDGIETGATADQTASEILTLIKTVDGSGSGLDADTLDGVNSGSFLRSDAADTTTGALTIDTTGRALLITGTGTLDAADASIYLGNAPASYGFDITYEGTGSGNTNAFVITSTNAGTPKELIRANQDGIVKLVQSGATIAGNTIWHAGNDGSGSGLDADTLDGIHGSGFLQISGGTLTGALSGTSLSLSSSASATQFIGTAQSTTAPTTDDAKFDGFGVQGNRTTDPIYVHNEGAGGVRISSNASLGTPNGILVKDTVTDISGNLTISGTVDGRDVAADGVTLDSATASNTPHAIVLRDGAGNFSAGTITAASVNIDGGFIDGTAIGHTTPDSGTFTNLTSNGNTTLGDAISDTVTFNAGAWTLNNNVTVTGTWADLGTVTTADINGGNIDGVNIGSETPDSGTFTGITVNNNIAVNGTVDGRDVAADGAKLDSATASNTPHAIVLRDGSGNFSAETITATLNGNVTSNSVDINGGNIDNTIIGGTTAVAGTFTDLTADGTINFAGATISNGGSVTTVDINGGFIDGTAIGHTTPDSATFTNLTADNLTVDTDTLFVDAGNNRVGIGTSSPNYLLDIEGASNSTYLRVGGDDVLNGRALTFTSSASASFNGAIHTINAPSSQGEIAFETNSSEALRIDASGNVGIGISEPDAALHVKDATSGAGRGIHIGTGSVGASDDAHVLLNGRANYGYEGGRIVISDRNANGTSTSKNFKISLYDSDQFYINGSAGRVGIGTNTPQTKLDVDGTVTASAFAGNASSATEVAITDDTTTNSTHYVHFGDEYTGTDGVKVSSSKLTFNPSTGSLQVGGLTVATTADLTAASSPNFSVDSANFGTANSFTIGEGKAVYYDTTTSKWEGAYNDSAGEYNASHVIVDMTSTDVKIASTGIFTLSGGLSANNYYFLSSTAGTTTNNPDSSPTIFQPLYYALDANTIDLNIQAPQDTVITTWPVGQNPGEETHGEPIVYSGIPSDERLKENIEAIQLNALDTVDELNPVSFDFKNPINRYQEGQQLGFIAQEILEVIPQSVYTDSSDSDATLILKPEAITPVLVKAIQELSGKVTELSAKVTSLEKEIEHMKPPVRKRRLR